MMNKNFMFLWSSQIISSFGNKLTIFGLPLIGIYVYDTSVLETSIITTLSFLPSLLFGTLIGVIVDKNDKRKIGIFTNLMCFLISIILFLLTIYKILPLFGFYIFIFLLNTFLLFGSISFYSQVPLVLSKEDLKKGNYKMEVSNSIIDTTAPTIAGIIFSVVAAPFVFMVDSITFLLASLCQWRISKDVEKVQKSNSKKYSKHIKDAYKYIYNNKLLLSLALSYFVLVFAIGIFQSIQFYYLSKILNMTAVNIGIVLSIGNVGLVVSSIFSLKISNLLGSGKTILLSFFLYMAGFFLYYISDDNIFFLSIASVCLSFAMPIYNVNAMTIRQNNVDLSILGSVSAVWRIFGRGLIPLGALVGGSLSTILSVRFTILVTCGIVFISVITLLFSKELLYYED